MGADRMEPLSDHGKETSDEQEGVRSYLDGYDDDGEDAGHIDRVLGDNELSHDLTDSADTKGLLDGDEAENQGNATSADKPKRVNRAETAEEREVKRLRRIQANRESARNTIRKKKAHMENLQGEAQSLENERARLLAERDELQSKYQGLRQETSKLLERITYYNLPPPTLIAPAELEEPEPVPQAVPSAPASHPQQQQQAPEAVNGSSMYPPGSAPQQAASVPYGSEAGWPGMAHMPIYHAQSTSAVQPILPQHDLAPAPQAIHPHSAPAQSEAQLYPPQGAGQAAASGQAAEVQYVAAGHHMPHQEGHHLHVHPAHQQPQPAPGHEPHHQQPPQQHHQQAQPLQYSQPQQIDPQSYTHQHQQHMDMGHLMPQQQHAAGAQHVAQHQQHSDMTQIVGAPNSSTPAPQTPSPSHYQPPPSMVAQARAPITSAPMTVGPSPTMWPWLPQPSMSGAYHVQ